MIVKTAFKNCRRRYTCPMNTDALQAVEYTLLTIGISCGFVASQLYLYKFGYDRGHDIGKHIGFTEGLFKGQERAQKKMLRTRQTPIAKIPTRV
jgi:hypothetical protein